MKVIINNFINNKVPENWEKVAYFSKKALGSWFNDFIERNVQLSQWSQKFETPVSVCISYLINPIGYLIAIKQNTARLTKQPLDDVLNNFFLTKFFFIISKIILFRLFNKIFSLLLYL